MEEYLSADETYKIIGILFEVHKHLGKGFSEIVYKDALNMNLMRITSLMNEKKNILSTIKIQF